MPEAISEEMILASIAKVPWSYLAHAYHKRPDAPYRLRQFVKAGRRNDAEALDWLDFSVLHQGNIYSASPPILWILTDLLALRLDHPAAEAILNGLHCIAEAYVSVLLRSGDVDEPHPVRKSEPGAPYWEVWVDGPLQYFGKAPPEYFRASAVTSRALREVILHARPVIAQYLRSPERTELFNAAFGAWFYSVQVKPIPETAISELRNLVGNSTIAPAAQVSAVMLLGALGEDIGPLITHPDWRVRLGAALSTTTQDREESVRELTAALEKEDQLMLEFPNGLVHVGLHVYFHIHQALLERTSPATVPRVTLDAICGFIQRHSSTHIPDLTWGRALEWAFPERRAPRLPLPPEEFMALPRDFSPTERAVLETLCRANQIWDPKSGNASLAFTRVQFPHDREKIRRLLST